MRDISPELSTPHDENMNNNRTIIIEWVERKFFRKSFKKVLCGLARFVDCWDENYAVKSC